MTLIPTTWFGEAGRIKKIRKKNKKFSKKGLKTVYFFTDL
jgi:hypothetical protein